MSSLSIRSVSPCRFIGDSAERLCRRFGDTVRIKPPGLVWLLLAFLVTPLSPGLGHADDQIDALIAKQAGVAARYQNLEALLLRLADMEAVENPERAALLKRAAKQSRDRFVLTKLEEASDALTKQEFQKAVDRQDAAAKELGAMLKLLLTEDRGQRIRDEKQRIAKVVKELKRVERAQRSTRARTENGADTRQLGDEQDVLAERSRELSDELSPEDEQKAAEADESSEKSDSSEPQQGEQQQGEQQQGEQQQGERQQGEQQQGERQQGEQQQGEQQQGEQQQGEQQQGEQQQGEQQQGEQQQGEQQQGEQQQQPRQPPASPQQQADQQIEQAIENMRKAAEELEKAERDQAVEKQREAEQNLRAAIDQLEQILRQLREEEIERELAKLEARLRQMAAMQAKVLDDTVALAATPESQRNRQTDLKAGDLAFEEKKITLESDRALLLLREEGSSVAFPEVVSQIRDDTIRVTERLGRTKIDGVTQGIQEDILAALEEMINALQKAQQDREKQKQRQQQQQQQKGGPQDNPLVEALAELKLIRTMETRIKSTTERYADLLESGETTGSEVKPLLENLAERQTRLYRITRDLVLERNQ